MAQGSFWGALALADVDALDWPAVRGLALRHLRWWSERPISDRDGVLSVGYGYDNRRMSRVVQLGRLAVLVHEGVRHARRARRPSVLDRRRSAHHRAPATVTCRTPGMVVGRDDGQVVALHGATAGLVVRGAGRRRSTRSSRTPAGSASAATSPVRNGRHRLDARGDRPGHRRSAGCATAWCSARSPTAWRSPVVTAARCAHRHRARGRRALARARAPHRPPTASSCCPRPGSRSRGSRKDSDLPAPDDPDAGRAGVASPWGASTIVDLSGRGPSARSRGASRSAPTPT